MEVGCLLVVRSLLFPIVALSVLGAVCLVGLVVVGALISRNKSKLKKRSSNSRLSAALPVTVLPN